MKKTKQLSVSHYIMVGLYQRGVLKFTRYSGSKPRDAWVTYWKLAIAWLMNRFLFQWKRGWDRVLPFYWTIIAPLQKSCLPCLDWPLLPPQLFGSCHHLSYEAWWLSQRPNSGESQKAGRRVGKTDSEMRICTPMRSGNTHGNTASLLSSYMDGTVAALHTHTWFDIAKMRIEACLGCMKRKSGYGSCILHGDLGRSYPTILDAE